MRKLIALIFASKHNLDPLVQYYGSQESLIREVLSTMNGSLPISPGPFSVQLNMHGYQLMVRAYIGDSGIPSISTMFIP